MANQDVKKNLLNHSEAKVKLLGAYINSYLNIICNDGYTQKIHIYDLFCGDGIYEDGGHGSPIVIMKAIKNVYYGHLSKRRSFPKINAFFNDINPDKVSSTKNAIATKSLHQSGIGTLEFQSEDYKLLLDTISKKLKSIKDEKSFIFLDPYQYKHIKISHIKELMSNKKTEVLLWLPTQFMYRFESNGTPPALIDFIEEMVPYDKWKQSSNPWDFIEELKIGFQKTMSEDFFVDNFSIQKDKNTVFCLFFFSPHIKGFEKIIEAKWKIDTEYGKGWNYTGNQPSLFHDLKTNGLEEKLIQYLKESDRTNADIYEFVLRCSFRPKHAKEVFSALQKQGVLIVEEADGTPARRNSFYITYEYFHKEPSKVKFKLN